MIRMVHYSKGRAVVSTTVLPAERCATPLCDVTATVGVAFVMVHHLNGEVTEYRLEREPDERGESG